MKPEVYWGSGSPYAWRVLLTLEIKGVPYESRLLEFSKGHLRTPAYRALNPRGRVPTLRDGDTVLGESVAIMAYLDRKHPEPPLFGRTAVETGRIWQSISACMSYLDPVAVRVFDQVFFTDPAKTSGDIQAAAKEVHAELAILEGSLASGPWLATGALSAADIVMLPHVELILRAAGKPAALAMDLGFLPFEARYPRLAAWRDRIRALPAYERTYPPHWRQAA